MTSIREPAVAGLFYPGSAIDLGDAVQRLLDDAPLEVGPAPKALVVPHAGYVYSGPVAAAAYTRLQRHRERYGRVVLLGPSHRVAFDGVAMSGADVFRSPLGDVAVDQAAIADLAMPELKTVDAPHQLEHSLEVHVPFLQTVLDSFVLVPLVVGHARPEAVARIIDALWGGPETLIVVSSDLSHYLRYDDARAIDRLTCTSIENLRDEDIDHDGACGATPLRGLLIAARRRGLSVETLDLRNSGDTAGDKDRVVGYGSWALV